MRLAELVAAVQEEHDASPAQIERWANARYSRMVSEARWRLAEQQIGSTVVGQDAYPVDPELLKLEKLTVGGVEFGRVSAEQMWAARAGTGRLCGAGVFCAGFDSAGVPAVRIFPVPQEAGLPLFALVALTPAPLGSNDSPVFPSSLHSFWLDGVIADAYSMLDGRQDLAAVHEQRFEEGIGRLGAMRVSRIGGGPVRVARPR